MEIDTFVRFFVQMGVVGHGNSRICTIFRTNGRCVARNSANLYDISYKRSLRGT